MTTDIDQGYSIVPDVIDAGEAMHLLQSIETSGPSRSRAGARHLMSHPAVNAVAHDPRLLGLAADFVGPSAVPYRATLFDKSSARNWLVPWHQDTALPLEHPRDVQGWGPWSRKAGVTYAHAPAAALSRVVALRLHFDESGRGNGPLRVLPRTHMLGVLTDAEVAELVERTTSVECMVGAGGVVVMRPLILHASSKAASHRPRRVLHVEYIDSRDVGSGLRVAIS
jgi:ectoine hydroxylase-related dioxygenase (phytanoyl-CoA dioxygenase family)